MTPRSGQHFNLVGKEVQADDGISSPKDIDLPEIGQIEATKGPTSALYDSGLDGNINHTRSDGHRYSRQEAGKTCHRV